MRVLLIRPPAISPQKEPSLIINEPLGLMYLAGYLNKYKKNVKVDIIDGFLGNEKFKEESFYGIGIPYKELSKKIEEFSPDIVGISCMFSNYYKSAHDAAKITKEISKEIVVVFGGAHASSFYEGVLKDPNVDLAVKGEGEATFLEIVQRYEKGQSLKDVDGTVIRIDGRIKVNSSRPFIKNLDEIPFPERELLDMSKYYNAQYSIRKSMAYPRLSMVTSRGCPFNCVFCSIHCIWNHTYRSRTPENIVDEIESLYKNYGIREIIFYDDNMTLDKIKMNEICDEIVNRKIDIRWSTPNGVAIWTLDKPTIQNMKNAGCYKITFGLESGSLDTLRFIRKNFIDFNKAKELIRFSNKIGLWTITSFIIGFPYEKKEDIDKTLAFAIDCDVDMASFYNATPYPGTELFDIYIKEGFFTGLDRNRYLDRIGDIGEAFCDTKYLTKEDINFLRYYLKKEFLKKRCISFLNPLRLLRKLKGLDEIRYFLKMMKNYFSTLRWAVFR